MILLDPTAIGGSCFAPCPCETTKKVFAASYAQIHEAIHALVKRAVVALWLAGQTINIMTLGGLALAVGILVDEATVMIENIQTHLARGEKTALAVFRAGGEVIVPMLLSVVAVLAVFVPSFFMTGVSRSLFVPLSLAVGFAMLASYFLSSSLVPVLAVWILRPEHAAGNLPSRSRTSQASEVPLLGTPRQAARVPVLLRQNRKRQMICLRRFVECGRIFGRQFLERTSSNGNLLLKFLVDLNCLVRRRKISAA